MGFEPENTLRSIRRALELGARCVEIDVQRVEQHLVVFHDDRLERTTNGSGFLGDHTFRDLRLLDAGKGERIATLDEVCALLKGRAGLNIELKDPDTAGPVAQAVASLVERGWDGQSFLVSSFSQPALREIRRRDPELQLGVLSSGADPADLQFAAELGAFSIHPARDSVSTALVRQAHALGLAVYVYTVNDPGEIRRMSELGVDGVFTDYPDRVAGPANQSADPPFWTRR